MMRKRAVWGSAGVSLALFAIVCAGCVGDPDPLPDTVVQSDTTDSSTTIEPPDTDTATVVEAPFDPSSISPEVKAETLEDIRAVIERLNRIIREKDFETWLSYCTPEYVSYWSSTETLKRLSESPVLKRSGVVLSSIYDFFIHVVFASRQNVKVDDIEFLGYNRVRVIMIGPKGERLIVYDLEKIGDTWKIAYWGEH